MALRKAEGVCERMFFNIFDAHQQGKQIKNKQQQSTFNAVPMQQCNATPPFFEFYDVHLLVGKQIKNKQQQYPAMQGKCNVVWAEGV